MRFPPTDFRVEVTALHLKTIGEAISLPCFQSLLILEEGYAENRNARNFLSGDRSGAVVALIHASPTTEGKHAGTSAVTGADRQRQKGVHRQCRARKQSQCGQVWRVQRGNEPYLQSVLLGRKKLGPL